jgi:hypothetical protein
VLSLSWAFDDDPAGRRSVIGQARRAGDQVNRVAVISDPCRNARFASLPTWSCDAAE